MLHFWGEIGKILLLNRPNLHNLQCGKRFLKRKLYRPGKPPTLPLAKTKRYRIINVPWHDPIDVKEMLWRRHTYQDALASIRLQIKKEYEDEDLRGAGGREAVEKRIAEEFEEILKVNDRENDAQALKRTQDYDAEMEETERRTLKEIEEFQTFTAQKLAEKEREVLKMIEESKTFVNRENLDEKIAHALENPVDFNFAIDLRANVYTGALRKKYLQEMYMIEQKFAAESCPAFKSGRLEPVVTGKTGFAVPENNTTEETEANDRDETVAVQSGGKVT